MNTRSPEDDYCCRRRMVGQNIRQTKPVASKPDESRLDLPANVSPSFLNASGESWHALNMFVDNLGWEVGGAREVGCE